MRDFLFYDLETGEQFFVESENLVKAREIAKEYFNCPKFIESVSAELADLLGYDTY